MSETRLPVSFYLQVLACSALWGSAFPIIKLSYARLALDSYGEQLLFAGTRFILAGLLVSLFCRSSVLTTLRETPLKPLLLVILGQTYFQYLFFYYALGISSGTLGALLVGAGSLWWVLLAPLFLKTAWPSGKQWLILLICSIGIAVAVYAPGAGSGNVGLGATVFLLASLSGAIGALGLKLVPATSGSRAITALSLFFGGLLLLLTGSFSWGEFLSGFGAATLWVTLYLAALSAMAFTLWNRLIERYSVNTLSAFRFMIPLCGVVESALFLEEETIGPGLLVGGTLVLGSLFFMGRAQSR